MLKATEKRRPRLERGQDDTEGLAAPQRVRSGQAAARRAVAKAVRRKAISWTAALKVRRSEACHTGRHHPPLRGGGHTAGGQMGEYEDRSTHSPRVACQVSKSRVVVPTLSQKKKKTTQNRCIIPSPTALLCTHIPTHPLSVHKRDASPNGASSLDCCFFISLEFCCKCGG